MVLAERQPASDSAGGIEKTRRPATAPESPGIYLHARYYDPQIGIFLSPDRLHPQMRGVGTNRYAYAFGNPVNWTDRSGFAVKICMPSDVTGKDDDCEALAYSETVTVTASGPELVWLFDYPIRDNLFTLGEAWEAAQERRRLREDLENKGSEDLGGDSPWTRNLGFLIDFLLGTGRTVRDYDDDDPQTRDMIVSPGADHMRDTFFDQGCQNLPSVGYGTAQAAHDTILARQTADLLSTAAQVGGFVGSVTNNGDGSVTYHIENEAGANSFVLHLPWVNNVEARPNGEPTPMRTIYQTFRWTEPASFAGCS